MTDPTWLALGVLAPGAHQGRRRAGPTAEPCVLGADRLRMRWVGHRLLAEVELRVADDLTVAEGHDIAHAARDALLVNVQRLVDATFTSAPPGTADEAGPAHTQGAPTALTWR